MGFSFLICDREGPGWTIWGLLLALTCNPIWLREEGVERSTAALDDEVLLPKPPSPRSCSLTDLPFIILLWLMQCFSHRALWDRTAEHTQSAGKERGSRKGEWHRRAFLGFPKPLSARLAGWGGGLPGWDSQRWRPLNIPCPPNLATFSPVSPVPAPGHWSLLSVISCFLSKLLWDSGSFL